MNRHKSDVIDFYAKLEFMQRQIRLNENHISKVESDKCDKLTVSERCDMIER